VYTWSCICLCISTLYMYLNMYWHSLQMLEKGDEICSVDGMAVDMSNVVGCLQVHTATRCSTLQHTCDFSHPTNWDYKFEEWCRLLAGHHCTPMQRTATICNTLPRTTTYCNTLPNTATHCHALQHACVLRTVAIEMTIMSYIVNYLQVLSYTWYSVAIALHPEIRLPPT